MSLLDMFFKKPEQKELRICLFNPASIDGEGLEELRKRLTNLPVIYIPCLDNHTRIEFVKTGIMVERKEKDNEDNH